MFVNPFAALQALAGDDQDDVWTETGRRARRLRGATHRSHTRQRNVPHEVFPKAAMRPRQAQEARDDDARQRVDAAYRSTADANAKLPEDERTPWVFPWQEQLWRDTRARRKRDRANRRAARR